MSEPSGKRLKTNLPICKTHRVFVGSKVKQNLPAVVEESLCGVSTLIMEIAYRFEALVRVSVELIGIYQTSLYYLVKQLLVCNFYKINTRWKNICGKNKRTTTQNK